MAVALEAVDLAALLAEACAWALLTILVILLAKLISKMHFSLDLGIVSFEPLGWLADALNSYILAGAEDARAAVAGAMKATYDGLVWSFEEMLGLFTDLGHAIKALALYLWQHVAKPYVDLVVGEVRSLANKAESAVESLISTVAKDLAAAEKYAEGQGSKAISTAEAFTKTEIAAARRDFTVAENAITARLDGIGTQAEAIAGDIAAAPGDVWGDLKQYVDPKNLAEATILGVLGGLAIHTLTDATGLSNDTCQENQKQLCGTNPSQWAKLLEGLVLLGATLDFKLVYDLTSTLVTDYGELIIKAEDEAWSAFS